MYVEQLQRRVAELESVIANNKSTAFGENGSGGSARQSSGRIFKGFAMVAASAVTDEVNAVSVRLLITAPIKLPPLESVKRTPTPSPFLPS